MIVDPNPGTWLVAGLAFVSGAFLIVKKKITFELGEDTGEFRTISGGRAKVVGALLIASGIIMIFNVMAGFIIFLGVLTSLVFLGK